MHELPVIQQILGVVDASIRDAPYKQDVKLVKVVLKVGKIREFIPDVASRYWDYCTRNTEYAGSQLELKFIDSTCSCNECGKVFSFDLRKTPKIKCPDCGCEKTTFLTGNEMIIDEIEVATVPNNATSPL